MADQLSLFDDSEDLPLFSGTAARAREDVFSPVPVSYQIVIFKCPICKDTGEVIVVKGEAPTRCTCETGKDVTP